MGGKGIRRREKNYRAAHGGSHSSRLPPPPTPSSIDALPSKLRKIMSLAGAIKNGNNNAGDGADKVAQGMESITTGMKRKRDGQSSTSQHKHQGDEIPEKNKKKKRNGKKAHDLRFEALDKAAAGSQKKDRRKKQLGAKKEKHKNAQIEEDMDFPGREDIKFGEVVMAPPKLTVPKAFKTAQPHDASHERLRLQAVEAYRKRKAWDARPGVKLPPPVTTSQL